MDNEGSKSKEETGSNVEEGEETGGKREKSGRKAEKTGGKREKAGGKAETTGGKRFTQSCSTTSSKRRKVITEDGDDGDGGENGKGKSSKQDEGSDDGSGGDCVACEEQKDHLLRATISRKTYKADVQRNSAPNAYYFSMDKQKIIMLPHLPGIKTAIFTRRILMINQTIAPLGGIETGNGRPLAF